MCVFVCVCARACACAILTWGAFWRGVRSDQKIMTTIMLLVMRQNDFSLDKGRDFIHDTFKFCYFSLNIYLQRIHLLHDQRRIYYDI